MPLLVDPFMALAKGYALYRPTYPSRLVEVLIEASGGQESVRQKCAVDIGCGSGQLTLDLAKAGFHQVVGVDRSEAQLRALEAKVIPGNAKFLQGEAVALPLPSGSCHLACMAQMLHWVPFEQGLLEARRVLEPKSGVLGVTSYAIPRIVNDVEAQHALNRYYFDQLGSNKPPGQGCLWDIDRRRVDSGYEGEPFSRIFSLVERHQIEEMIPTTVGAFLGYLRTQTAYQNALEVFENPLSILEQILGGDDTKPLHTEITFHLIVCRV